MQSDMMLFEESFGNTNPLSKATTIASLETQKLIHPKRLRESPKE